MFKSQKDDFFFWFIVNDIICLMLIELKESKERPYELLDFFNNHFKHLRLIIRKLILILTLGC